MARATTTANTNTTGTGTRFILQVVIAHKMSPAGSSNRPSDSVSLTRHAPVRTLSYLQASWPPLRNPRRRRLNNTGTISIIVICSSLFVHGVGHSGPMEMSVTTTTATAATQTHKGQDYFSGPCVDRQSRAAERERPIRRNRPKVAVTSGTPGLDSPASLGRGSLTLRRTLRLVYAPTPPAIPTAAVTAKGGVV
ncbi:hypothetical protein BC827DRAFT_1219468 [Russula dissimulans]|nr:hypothetical protein BC827DRAFT_1219468 [Russula dissimulans]